MDSTKRQRRKRQQQSNETAKHETAETHRNGKQNVEQDNKAHCSKKSKVSVNEESRTLRSRVEKDCSSHDAKVLHSKIFQNSSDKSGNNNRKRDKLSKKSNKKPNTESQPSAQDENVSEEVNCNDCKKCDDLLTEKIDANSSTVVCDLSASVKTVRKIMQPIKCVKRVCHDKNNFLESSHTNGKNSSNNGHPGSMVHQLPSKFAMFAEFPKSLVENKFGPATSQPVSKASSQHRDNLLHLLMDNSFGVKGGVHGKKVCF